jgi:hypothetical protein
LTGQSNCTNDHAMYLPSGEIATSAGVPSVFWPEPSRSGGGSIRFSTRPCCVIRTISPRRAAAMVPSSASDGEKYGRSGAPSVVTARAPDPSARAIQMLSFFKYTIEPGGTVAASACGAATAATDAARPPTRPRTMTVRRIMADSLR